MTEKDLIRKCMKIKGVSQGELAKQYGYKTQSGISSALDSRKSMRVDVMIRLLDLLGYEVHVMDRATGENFGAITTKLVSPKQYNIKEKKESEKKEIPVFQYGK